MSKRTAMAGLLIAAMSFAAPARAQSTPQDLALADALYKEAQQFMHAGRWAEAKPKLEACLALDLGIGTLENLAFVEDKLGLTASSWSHYNQAHATAVSRNDSRAKRLAEEVSRVEALLAKLLLDVAPANRAAEIRRDGTAILVGAWNTPIPLDPGRHTIEVSQPGKQPWSTTVVIEAKPGMTTVKVPPLEDALPEAPTPPPVPLAGTEAGSGGGSMQRPLGFAALGVGGAGLLAGAITLGLDASKNATLAHACSMRRCGATLQPDITSYHTLGIVSTTGFVVGGALAATGALLVILAPRTNPRAASVSPVVGPGYAGLSARF